MNIALSHAVCTLREVPFFTDEICCESSECRCDETQSVWAIVAVIAGAPRVAAAVLLGGAIVIHEKYISFDIAARLSLDDIGTGYSS
jgi:hypothetical protein